jgi:hypothetical protein
MSDSTGRTGNDKKATARQSSRQWKVSAEVFYPAASLVAGKRRRSEVLVRQTSGNATNSLLKKASEHAIANAIKNSSSPKANKKRDSMSQRTSK